MAVAQAPKQWQLTTNETLTSFTNWKENLVYILSLNGDFRDFVDGNAAVWQDGDVNNRGFVNDGHPIPEDMRRTAAQKAQSLRLMLGQIANYCNVIARHQIVEDSTSLDSIWGMIREHFGFHITGSRYLDLAAIRLEPGEKPADLYQRLVSFFTDNLFTRASNLTHKGRAAVEDERLSVSLQNTIVVLWLERLHVGLPGLVKQRYGTELRNKTLASIKPEISQALGSLLDELKSSHHDDPKIMRLHQSRQHSFNRSARGGHSNSRGGFNNSNTGRLPNPKLCSLCKTANIPGYDTHFLSQCKYISERDRRQFTSRVRLLEMDEDPCFEDDNIEVEVECDTFDNSLFIDKPASSTHRRVTTRKSPHMNCFYNHYPAQVCLDSGSESSLISSRFAKHAGIPILTQSVHQGAVQADASSTLEIVGEAKNIVLRYGSHTFMLDALVTGNDIGDIIAGEPFLEVNDIALRPSKKQIIIKGSEIIPYSNSL